MDRTHSRWHERFQQQAGWTRQLRKQVLADLNLGPSSRILDLGSGSGALFPELSAANPGCTYGIDIDLPRLRFSADLHPGLIHTAGDGRQLPFPGGTFDLVLCHFTLLWIEGPLQAVREMVRVARPGGTVAALAEPDYGGRIDHPAALRKIRDLQIQSLKIQGADPRMGRKLRELFRDAGVKNTSTGVYQGAWTGEHQPENFRREWEILQADLKDLVPPAALEAFREADLRSRQAGRRVLYVPTFYAVGSA